MVVGAMLRERGLTLATAESATGGQLASLITEAPGASDYFVAGYVAYSADAKRALGVSAETIERHGTVAEATTQALAAAARRQADADVGRRDDRQRRTRRLRGQARRRAAHRRRHRRPPGVLRDALFDDAHRVQAPRRAGCAVPALARAQTSRHDLQFGRRVAAHNARARP